MDGLPENNGVIVALDEVDCLWVHFKALQETQPERLEMWAREDDVAYKVFA